MAKHNDFARFSPSSNLATHYSPARYPMLFIVISFAAGLATADASVELRTSATILWPILSLFAILGFRRFQKLTLASALFGLYFAGVAIQGNLYRTEELITHICPEAHPVRINAHVIDVPLKTNKYLNSARRGGTIVEFDLPLVGGGNQRTRAITYFNENEDIELLPNDKIRIIGTLARPRPMTLPGIYDRPKSLARFGIYLQISGASVEERKSAPWWSISSAAARLRRKSAEVFRSHLQPRHAEIFIALVLGYRYGVNPEDRAIFTESGLGHLFAVSGLHVAILALMVGFILSLLDVGTKKRALILGTFVIFYALVVGPRPPVVRAAVMILTYLTATLIGRGRDTINTISFAAFALLVYSPAWHDDPGFLLSFAAVGCIVLLFPVLEELWMEFRKNDIRLEIRFERSWRHALQDWFRHAIFVSLAAQIGVQPLLMHFMGFINPWGVLANVLVLPLAAAVLAVGVLMVCLGLVSAALGGVISLFAAAILAFLLKIADILSMLPWSIIYVSLTESISLLLFYSLLLVVLLGAHARIRDIWDESPQPLNKKALRYGAGLALGLLIIGAIVATTTFEARPRESVTIIESGRARAALLLSRDGKKILIGAGSPGSGRYLAGKLLASGVRSLDTVAIPKDLPAYTTGLTSTLNLFEPDTLLLPRALPPSKQYSENIIAATEFVKIHGGNVLRPEDGDELQLAESSALSWHTINGDSNAASILLWRDNNISVGFVEFLDRHPYPPIRGAIHSPVDVLVIAPPEKTFTRAKNYVDSTLRLLRIIIDNSNPRAIILSINKTTQNTLWAESVMAALSNGNINILLPKDGAAVSVFCASQELILEACVNGQWERISTSVCED